MISTKDNKPVDRREVLKQLREFHQATFDNLNIPNAVFIPKMAYKPYGKTEVHISFFKNEINRGEDIYVEFCSKDLMPEDPERRLYKWRFNAHFEEEYDTTEPHPTTGDVRYLVPVGELIVIKVNSPGEKVSKADEKSLDLNFELPDPNQDCPIDQLTIRDLAAILLRKPISHKKFLNQIILGK